MSDSTEAKKPKILKDYDEMIDYLNFMSQRVMARIRCASALDATKQDGILANEEIDPNARLETGESMLLTVLSKVSNPEKQLHYVKLLVLEGADVNEVDTNGCTPLMIAIEQCYENTAKTLIKPKITNHYATDNNGWTALHHTAASGREGIMRVYLGLLRKLEEKKTKDYENIIVLLDIENNDRQTVKQLAEKVGHLGIAEMIADEKNSKHRMLSNGMGMIYHSGIFADARRFSQLESSMFDQRRRSDQEELVINEDGDANSNISINVQVKVTESSRMNPYQGKGAMAKQQTRQTTTATSQQSNTIKESGDAVGNLAKALFKNLERIADVQESTEDQPIEREAETQTPKSKGKQQLAVMVNAEFEGDSGDKSPKRKKSPRRGSATPEMSDRRRKDFDRISIEDPIH